MSRAETYEEVRRQALSVLDGEPDLTARMATVTCLLAGAFPDNNWTGFYVVDPLRPDELVVGPYQGGLGCLRIAFGRGVCGTAAASGESQVVEDVHAFPGHIACDAASRSEIVVPVRGRGGALVGVLDIDSPEEGTFGAVDREALEGLVAAVFGGGASCS